MELSLLLESNGTGHADLFLLFAGKTYTCDSYYLAIDSESLPNLNGGDPVRAVLATLLWQWLSAVEGLPDGGTAYLPYDFSDQYTGWLRCVRSGDAVTVSRGWADEPEGWALSPSSVGEHMSDLAGFRADGPTCKVPASELLDAIRASTART